MAPLLVSFTYCSVPGPVADTGHARTVITEAWETEGPDQVERLVEVRTLRQELLTRPRPIELRAVLCEAALDQRIGGPYTMRARVHHLLEASRLPHLTLQVLPHSAGAHPGLTGSFTVLGFSEGAEPDVVLVENLTSSRYFEDKRELARYQWTFERLTAMAASPRESASLIKKAAKELS
jgi:hypothetical protein